MKVNKCACCIPVSIAVKILGTLDVIYWIMAIVKWKPFDMINLTMPAVTFIVMTIGRDTKVARKTYFFVFAFSRAILLFIFAYFIIPMVYVGPTEE